jgi:hypothetical protein
MAHKFIPVEIRFWKYIVRPDDPDACWEWTGATQKEGYGLIRGTPPDTRNVTASHVSYRVHVGPIPEGHKVLHRCDNPPCCNPLHLFTGTQTDNMRDCSTKRRGRRSKLSAQQFRAIQQSNATQNELASAYGVSQGLICLIRNHQIKNPKSE